MTPTCSLILSFNHTLQDLFATVLGHQNQEARRASLRIPGREEDVESIGEPHGKAVRKIDRGMECKERVVKRLSLIAVSMGAPGTQRPISYFLGLFYESGCTGRVAGWPG